MPRVTGREIDNDPTAHSWVYQDVSAVEVSITVAKVTSNNKNIEETLSSDVELRNN